MNTTRKKTMKDGTKKRQRHTNKNLHRGKREPPRDDGKWANGAILMLTQRMEPKSNT